VNGKLVHVCKLKMNFAYKTSVVKIVLSKRTYFYKINRLKSNSKRKFFVLARKRSVTKNIALALQLALCVGISVRVKGALTVLGSQTMEWT
jgi:hypothetical protein